MAMFTVDHKVGIEREHSIVNFGHPYNTRVGERHCPISIFLMQLAKGGNVLIDAQRDSERTIFKKSEQSIPVLEETWRADASLPPEPAHTRAAAVVVHRSVR